ncbi:MAG: purine-nucleoside phosphorylase [Firmicutes bacterium]|uniref:Uridine phosphorylase n=1 Tax=Candidatus Onthovivens merdipullorum TaxID=2840889 RepID=A0A9D9DHA1_9BACL|nr:purine-nucleoside phosphorylase [Candidatus Onthovivens merdipullorum]
MSTHIDNNAKFAKTVLMPGDPLRAKYIAENYLVDYKLVTSVRGILGYTGKTKDGKEISVMASGMGVPSIGIYSYELFNEYGVENIIRIGTCGSYQKEVHVGDVIITTSASSNSNYARQFDLKGGVLAPCSDFSLILKAYENSKKLGLNVHVGPIFSSDIFYDEDKEYYKKWQRLGILGVEMESYGLFINAMKLHKKALCILTVSDTFASDERELTQLERQTSLENMFKLALTMAE